MNVTSPRPLPPPPVARDDFLALLDARPGERWELIDGVPLMMVGGTLRHSLIAGNVAAALRRLARSRGCQAHASDLLVSGGEASDFLAAPDVFVRCGPADETARFVTDPTVVVEVLSPSTMRLDRGAKFEQYRAMPSVEQILLVYQDQIRVESWTRTAPPAAESDGEGETFAVSVATSLAAAVALPGLGADLPLAAVYDGVAGLTGAPS